MYIVIPIGTGIGLLAGGQSRRSPFHGGFSCSIFLSVAVHFCRSYFFSELDTTRNCRYGKARDDWLCRQCYPRSCRCRRHIGFGLWRHHLFVAIAASDFAFGHWFRRHCNLGHVRIVYAICRTKYATSFIWESTTAAAFVLSLLAYLPLQWVVYFLPAYFQLLQGSSPSRSGVQLEIILGFESLHFRRS